MTPAVAYECRTAADLAAMPDDCAAGVRTIVATRAA
jgi:hypothetical protein